MESQTVWCRREGEVGSNTWKGAWTQVQQVRAIRREGRSGGPDWGCTDGRARGSETFRVLLMSEGRRGR